MKVFLAGLAGLFLIGACMPMPISDRAAERRGLHTGKPFDLAEAMERAAKAQRSIDEGYYGPARPGIETTLALLLSLKNTRSKEVNEAIPEMYYLLACIDSLASVGKSNLSDSPKNITISRTTMLQNRALANLKKAVRSGFRGFDQARKDPALAPIRDLDGFETALKSRRTWPGLFGRSAK
ncbi:MAG: hypothetical protein ACYTFG_12390 [Planctomycetota bacterium]